jgi:hypothetical protein
MYFMPQFQVATEFLRSLLAAYPGRVSMRNCDAECSERHNFLSDQDPCMLSSLQIAPAFLNISIIF